MISVQEALSIIENGCPSLAPVQLPLVDAKDAVLAEDVYSAFDIPAYAQSSMDGYAFRFVDRAKELSITGEMAAGTDSILRINQGEAARIFTGAPLPKGADTVVMQEKVLLRDRKLSILDDTLKQGGSVRPAGSEVKKGEKAMPAGAVLSTPVLGFLSSIGITQVTVYPKPRVGLIITGNEIQNTGEPLALGKVYDANSIMIRSALKDVGIENVLTEYAGDDLTQLSTVLSRLIEKCDLILLTGGVSVGDYDFVTKAAGNCGVTTRFHKIKQRPGKPLFYGTAGDKQVFGLPGNPSSALTCFYIYVLPAISAMQKKDLSCKRLERFLKSAFEKPEGLTQFVKAFTHGEHVEILPAQESFRLHSFARANCLAELSESRARYEPGESITIHLLPQ